jgi:DNA ligase-1
MFAMEYQTLAKLFFALEQTSKRLKKTSLLAAFLKDVPLSELEQVILLVQGRVFPLWDKRVLGLSEKLLIKAIATSSGASEKLIMDEWRKIGDIGLVAEHVLKKKSQATLFSENLTVAKVFENLRKVASSEGKGATELKTKLVAQLLSSAQGLEAKYIVRAVIGDLRIGIADGTLRDALLYAFIHTEADYDDELNAWIYEEPKGDTLEKVKFNTVKLQSALDRSNDFALVAKLAKSEGISGLSSLHIVPGVPLKVMLAQKVANFAEGFEKVGLPAAIEYKFDGFRMSIHKTVSGDILLFTRRLENVTQQFPDVVRMVQERVKGSSFILDAEAVGFDPKTKKYRPFQDVSQRIRRKYDIAVLEKDLPVELAVFDVLFFEGEEFLEKPFKERREKLSSLFTSMPQKIILAPQLVTADKEKAEQFYKESLLAGNEGVMLKKLDAPYQPGSRVGTMIKLKPTMDTFDLAIIAAEWGTGKRSGWLTSFSVACFDEMHQELVALGKFGTGIKEKAEAAEGDAITFEELTERLKPFIIATDGREVQVKPTIIVEVKFEEVQSSPSYASGFALRFPRFVRLREDRGLDDMTTLSMVEASFKGQRGR